MLRIDKRMKPPSYFFFRERKSKQKESYVPLRGLPLCTSNPGAGALAQRRCEAANQVSFGYFSFSKEK